MFWRREIVVPALAILSCGGCIQATQTETDTNTYFEKETAPDTGLETDTGTDTESRMDTDSAVDTGIDTDTHSCEEMRADRDFPPVDLQTAVPCDANDHWMWRSCAIDDETQGAQTCSSVARENDVVEYYWSVCVEICDAAFENKYRECNTGTRYGGTQFCVAEYSEGYFYIWTACAVTDCLDCYPDEKRVCGPETEYPGLPMECFVPLTGDTFWSDSPCYVK